jgi:hypothetical protein
MTHPGGVFIALPGAVPFRSHAFLIVVVVAIGAASCTSQTDRLQQSREHLRSLSASTAAIGKAWLESTTSNAYASTALRQMFLLVEKERSTLAGVPDDLIDPRGAELSWTADGLSRLLAAMMQDVRSGNVSSMREHLTRIPTVPPAPR